MKHKDNHKNVPNDAAVETRVDARRRTLLKTGAAAALPIGALMPAGRADAQAVPTAPPTTPFLEPLPIPPVLQPRTLGDVGFTGLPPTVQPNRARNPATGLPYEGRGDAHQLRDPAVTPTLYVQRYGAVPPVSIHPQLPNQVNFWGSNLGGADFTRDPPRTPMPTIVARQDASVANTSILIRRYNQLPTGAPSGGFGRNSVSMHVHNLHTAPDSDGGPCDPSLGALAEDPYTQGRFFFPGQYYDYYHNLKRAGFTGAFAPGGDVRESQGTLWYHDHREGHTAENVSKGLMGFFIVFNEYDTGNETTGFKLPSWPQYDIPLCIVDMRIDPVSLQASFDLADRDGHLGNKYVVNGKVQPYFNVNKRRYRFRLLNAGPARFHQIFLVNPDRPTQAIPMWQIANDGNLLPKPLQVGSVKLAVAERADVIIDFAALTAPGGPAAGATRLRLENRLVQDSGRGPRNTLSTPGLGQNALVEFRIGAAVADASANPASITSFAPITLPPLETPTVTRNFKFGHQTGAWLVNGRLISCDEVRFTMKRGRLERWIFSTGSGWSHPIHNHYVEGRIISRNGVPITPSSPEYCRKDVVWLGEGETVEYWVRPTDYTGVYPIHCHNVTHEDHGMMLLFRVNDIGDTNEEP